MAYSFETVRSVYLAAATGDSLGLILEHREAGPSREWLKPEDIHALSSTQLYYSDDTELLLITTESIVASCGLNPQDLLERLVTKASTRNPVRRYSLQLAEVLEAIRRGVEWKTAVKMANGWRGGLDYSCLARVPPVALFYSRRESVELMSIAQARVTHVNMIGVEGARLYGIALYELLHGRDVSSLTRILRREAILEAYRERLEAIDELIESRPERVAQILGNGVSALEVLSTAIYALVKAEGDVMKAIAYSLSLGGEAGSRAFISASLAATQQPTFEPPKQLASTLEALDAILDAAKRLYDAMTHCT